MSGERYTMASWKVPFLLVGNISSNAPFSIGTGDERNPAITTWDV